MMSLPNQNIPQNTLLSSHNHKWISSLLIVAITSATLGYLIGIQKGKNTNPTPTYTRLSSSPTTLPFPTISTTPTYQTPTPDPTLLNWKTSVNASGLSLKYPPHWNIATNSTPDSTTILFTINTPNSNKDSLIAGFHISKNINYVTQQPKYLTLAEWMQDNGKAYSKNLPQEQTIIDGQNAIKTKIPPDIEDYLIIAPGLNTANALYNISFGADGEGVKNPYAETDQFTHQELTNFHKVLTTIKFSTK